MNELELVENKDLRVTRLDRIEVLDRVGGLILLPNVDVATTKQLANYFNIPLSTFKECYQNNLNELQSNGAKLVKGSELKELKTKTANAIELNRVPSIITFTKRAILNVAMLLTESEVAKNIRDILSKEYPELYFELSKENQLRFKKYETEIKNYLEFSFGKENVESQVILNKYRLDFVLFNNIHIEVDENGHSSYNDIKESERENYILKNTDYYTIRYNPNLEKPCDLIFKIKDLYDNIGFPNILCN